jgi:hypothetical protein
MATRTELPPFARFTVLSQNSYIRAFLRLLSLLAVFFTFVSQVSAQTSTQQYVYLSLPGSPPSSPSSLISGFRQQRL